MTATVEDLGAAMLAEVEADALARLADLARRHLRRACDGLMAVAVGRLAGQRRADAEAARVAGILSGATPPVEMRAAPVAPARGVMHLVTDFEVQPGGTRKRVGAHWVEPTRLDLDNRRAVAKARERLEEIEAERLAAGLCGISGGVDRAARRAAPFTSGQVAVAEEYRTLVEWREGSPLRCAGMETGRSGGGGSGLFIETYVKHGDRLRALQAAIGDGLALAPARVRGAARRAIAARVLVDMVVLQGASLTEVLQAHGWAAHRAVRDDLRQALSGALDRMQACR